MTTFKRNFDFNYNYMRDISMNIKKFRKIAGITQEQLAVYAERSPEFVRRIESEMGERGFSIETLYRISVVLEKDVGEFFKRDNLE